MKKRWRIIPHERIKLSNVENDASPGPSKKEILFGKKKLRGNGSVGIVKITLQSLVQSYVTSEYYKIQFDNVYFESKEFEKFTNDN